MAISLTAAQKHLLADIATTKATDKGNPPLIRVWVGNEYRWQYNGANVTRVARSLIRKGLIIPEYPAYGGSGKTSEKGAGVAETILASVESPNAAGKVKQKRRKRRAKSLAPSEPSIDRPGRGHKMVTGTANKNLQ